MFTFSLHKNINKTPEDAMVYTKSKCALITVSDADLQLQPNFHEVNIETNCTCSFVSDKILKDAFAKCNNLLSTLVM